MLIKGIGEVQTAHSPMAAAEMVIVRMCYVAELPSPEEYFGFEMGADRKLARWDKLVDYYNLLGEQSPRLEVVNMGPSTLDNPFLVLFISSPENLANLLQWPKTSQPIEFSERSDQLRFVVEVTVVSMRGRTRNAGRMLSGETFPGPLLRRVSLDGKR